MQKLRNTSSPAPSHCLDSRQQIQNKAKRRHVRRRRENKPSSPCSRTIFIYNSAKRFEENRKSDHRNQKSLHYNTPFPADRTDPQTTPDQFLHNNPAKGKTKNARLRKSRTLLTCRLHTATNKQCRR